MNLVQKHILQLNARYSKSKVSLKKDYEEALHDIQKDCSHESTNWEYRLDTHNKLASDVEGTPYLYKECSNCTYIERKLDNKENYDSEIEI